MNQMKTARKILNAAIQTGMAEITPSWKVYTKEYLEKDKSIDPFTRNRMITMKDGEKCRFIIMPADTSTPGGFDYFKCGNEKMAHFQIFSVLFNGEPDRLEDYEDNQAKAVVDTLMAEAKSKSQGFGTPNRPSCFIDKDGCINLSPAADELLRNKDGYVFLMPELTKMRGVEYIAGYYLKISEYVDSPFPPKADENHRVYVFEYVRNKKTGDLTQGGYTIKLSPEESRDILTRWDRYKERMDSKEMVEAEEVKPCFDKDGEAYVDLIPDGETKPLKFRVADLMWESFKGVIPPGMKVLHIDGNKANNAIGNLKLVTIG